MMLSNNNEIYQPIKLNNKEKKKSSSKFSILRRIKFSPARAKINPFTELPLILPKKYIAKLIEPDKLNDLFMNKKFKIKETKRAKSQLKNFPKNEIFFIKSLMPHNASTNERKSIVKKYRRAIILISQEKELDKLLSVGTLKKIHNRSISTKLNSRVTTNRTLIVKTKK